jgi:hypothetical protein
MRHTNLDHRPVERPELDEQLRRQEGTPGRQPDVGEGLAAEELAGAIDIPNLQAEEDPQAGPVDPRVGEPDGWISTLDAIADDDVGECRRGLVDGPPDPVEQTRQVSDPELPVAVGEADERISRGAEPAAQRSSISLVDAVMDRPLRDGPRWRPCRRSCRRPRR